MYIASRIKNATNSITLKLNEKAQKLTDAGIHIYNLTQGQLPFKPSPEFVEKLSFQLNFLKSYQYSPIAGFKELRDKLMTFTQERRGIDLSRIDTEFDCIVSNGTKHSIYNVLGAIIDPSDEVILLAPYWVSYPEMIKFWGGTPIVVGSNSFEGYLPHVEDIEKVISPRTKAIIVNSPNNPSGNHYPAKWMDAFAELMKKHEHVLIISDEIYHELFYFDPRPNYFYQNHADLLPRTIITDGISKAFAATGLRIGYCIANKKIISAMEKIQGQTTSGANSLVQRALIDFDFSKLNDLLVPIKFHLRKNAQTLREEFRNAGLSNCWYQTTSAFYFMLDFSRTPFFNSFTKEPEKDFSQELTDYILDKIGVAMVPGTDFGMINSARMSLVLEEKPFEEAMKKLVKLLSSSN
jgi:aspartate aminotransferase